MTYYLFDSIRGGLIIALLVEVALFLAWAFTAGKVKKRYLLTGPLIVALFLLMDFLVETNREQLERITRQIVKAAELEDAPGIIRHLSDDFKAPNGYDKAQASTAIQNKLRQSLIEENSITALDVLSHQDLHGQVEFTVVTRLDTKSPYATIPLVTTHWQFDYTCRPGSPYQVQSITMLWLVPGMFGAHQNPIDIFSYRPSRR